jgi:hypothetical protein
MRCIEVHRRRDRDLYHCSKAPDVEVKLSDPNDASSGLCGFCDRRSTSRLLNGKGARVICIATKPIIGSMIGSFFKLLLKPF